MAILVAAGAPSTSAHARTLGMVTNESHNSVTVFDADADAVVGSVGVGPGIILDCSVNEAQTRGYVTDFNYRVWVIDLSTWSPTLAGGTNPIPISNYGEDTSLTPDGRFLLVCAPQTNFTDPAISVIDTASQSEVSTFSIGGSCLGIEACSDGSVLALGFNHVYRLMIDGSGMLTDTGDVLSQSRVINVLCAPDAKSGIAVIDAQQFQSFQIPGLTPADTRPLSGVGISGVMNPAGDQVFIRTSSSGSVAAFGYTSSSAALSASPLFSIAPIPAAFSGLGTDQMARHPSGTKLYVSTNSAAGSNPVNAVQVYDATGGMLLSSITDPSLTQPSAVCLPAHPRLCNHDHVVDLSEQCDDGNTDDNDACKNDCTLNVCGDGVGNVGVEECDDGNTDNNDACKNDCTLDVCGDDVLHDGVEQCDDGNLVDGDGCDSNCTPTGCGNGVVSAGEQCDDGNQVSGDSCPAGCVYTDGHSLIPGNSRNPARDRVGCQVEWYVANPNNPLGPTGLPTAKQTCQDGDASCDFRPDQPGVCEFRVALCVNTSDVNLPACSAGGVSAVRVSPAKPHPVVPAALREGMLTADVSAIQHALQHLLDPQHPERGYTNTPPLATGEQTFCSAPFVLDVPLAGARKRTVILEAVSTGMQVPVPRKQHSRLHLTCKPPS